MSAWINLFDRLQTSGVIGRLYMLFISALVGYQALFEPLSLNRLILVKQTNGETQLLALILLVASVIGFVDAFINDIFPESWVLVATLEFRHLGLMVIAACFAVAAYLSDQYDKTPTVTVFYTVHFSVISLAAFFDIRRRYKRT